MIFKALLIGSFKKLTPNIEYKMAKQSSMPYVKDAIAKKIATLEQVAYLDLSLERLNNMLIIGNYDARKPIVDMIKDLASQRGRLYHIQTAGTLDGILSDETPFGKNDFVVVNLDLPDKDVVRAYLNLIASRRIKGIAELGAGSLNDSVYRLEQTCKASRQAVSKINTICVASRDAKLNQITEIVGLDGETNELLTAALFEERNVFQSVRMHYIDELTGGAITLDKLSERAKNFEKLLP